MTKLTLRDLFAVVTIVALALGWWLDRRRLAGTCEQLDVMASDALSSHLDTQAQLGYVERMLEDCLDQTSPAE